MTMLLVLTAVLLLASGLIKLRAGGRAGMGITLLPLVEAMAGLTLLAPVSLSWRPSPALGLSLTLASVLLVLVSSLFMGVDLSRRRRARVRSEGARLSAYVRYVAREKPPGE
jgi:hypothetical protein